MTQGIVKIPIAKKQPYMTYICTLAPFPPPLVSTCVLCDEIVPLKHIYLYLEISFLMLHMCRWFFVHSTSLVRCGPFYRLDIIEKGGKGSPCWLWNAIPFCITRGWKKCIIPKMEYRLCAGLNSSLPGICVYVCVSEEKNGVYLIFCMGKHKVRPLLKCLPAPGKFLAHAGVKILILGVLVDDMLTRAGNPRYILVRAHNLDSGIFSLYSPRLLPTCWTN